MMNKRPYQPDAEILRNYQLSHKMKLLQIQNGYMQLIASSVLVSNHAPEKCGFETIKRANPSAWIHPSEL